MHVFPLREYVAIAAGVLEIDEAEVVAAVRWEVALAALEAPFVTLAGERLYPHPIDQAATLAARLVLRPALPRGNRRVATICASRLLHLSGYRLDAPRRELLAVLGQLARRPPEVTEDDLRDWFWIHVPRR